MNTNKFQIDWQIVRLRAKQIKDAAEKAGLVEEFLKANLTIENKERVLNWAKMTAYGYGDTPEAYILTALYNKIEDLEVTEAEVYSNDFSKYSWEELALLESELRKRKYDFQMGSKVPESHIVFARELEAYILDNKPRKQMSPSEFLRAYRKNLNHKEDKMVDDSMMKPVKVKKERAVKVVKEPKAKKLTMEQVREIRASEKKTSELAKEFGVSTVMVYNIKKGKLYKEAA